MIEREREVELPPKAEPTQHSLHPDVVTFVISTRLHKSTEQFRGHQTCSSLEPVPSGNRRFPRDSQTHTNSRESGSISVTCPVGSLWKEEQRPGTTRGCEPIRGRSVDAGHQDEQIRAPARLYTPYV